MVTQHKIQNFQLYNKVPLPLPFTTMSFPSSNFEGNFSNYVFGKSFRHYRKLKIDCWTSRHIYNAKKYEITSCEWKLEFL